MGNCNICGKYSCSCCVTPPPATKVQHPEDCRCYPCYRKDRDAPAKLTHEEATAEYHENGEFAACVPITENEVGQRMMEPATDSDSRQIWTEYMKGCGNTASAELPPWHCAECTDMMLSAMDRAMEREASEPADEFKPDVRKGDAVWEINRLRDALEYIMEGGPTHAAKVARLALRYGSTTFTRAKAQDG
jgi:hypothetical protein